MTNITILTVAQALIKYLLAQRVSRDGHEQPFFGGCFGIFGHGNIAGMGQALQQFPQMAYWQARNEQAMVHSAVAYAKHSNRLKALACTSSIGPGATNMVTGAALATINRLPVLLIPGDIFARRNVAPVLQQLEYAGSQDISVNDAFKPVSRYWDRINRADQLTSALPEAMRILTSPSETGAVTLCLPQDTATESHAFPTDFFQSRVWHIPRNRADATSLARAVQLIRASKAPMIVAGGGVRYAEATTALARFALATGIPVGETMAGKGSLIFDNPLCMGAVGATGTSAANEVAAQADLVIGIGTRYSDFTTASKSLWQNSDVTFININVTSFDAQKHSALALVGDALVTLDELTNALQGWRVSPAYASKNAARHQAWDVLVQTQYDQRNSPLPAQAEIIGAVNEHGDSDAIMVCAAGSLPGDLHKLWRTRHPSQYHLEYGFSTMGYEIAGGLGVKMAAPEREVYVMVGDGSYLMMNSEIITSIQYDYKLTIILIDNNGYQSIGGLSRSLGQAGFGTRFVKANNSNAALDDGSPKEVLSVDLAANAESLGAHVIKCAGTADVIQALAAARLETKTTVIFVHDDRYIGTPGFGWWDVPPAEVSTSPTVTQARARWEGERLSQRSY